MTDENVRIAGKEIQTMGVLILIGILALTAGITMGYQEGRWEFVIIGVMIFIVSIYVADVHEKRKIEENKR